MGATLEVDVFQKSPRLAKCLPYFARAIQAIPTLPGKVYKQDLLWAIGNPKSLLQYCHLAKKPPNLSYIAIMVT